jgi:Spy/CpxP family protein refolding chaperone
MMKWFAAVCLCLMSASLAGAQPPGNRGRGNGGVSPVELQRMFDAYALMQAQQQLNIGDDRYPEFLTRFKALQDVRRKSLVDRVRVIADLRRLASDPQSDENTIKERLKALQDLEQRTATDIQKAYDGVDQVLDVHQQAKFRVFEEVMERRKLELISRARQAARPRKPR